MKVKNDLRMAARDLYKTWTLLHLYPDRYRKLAAEKKVQPGKVVFVEVRMARLTDSFTPVYEALKQQGNWQIRCLFLREGMLPRGQVRRIALEALEELADAAWIITNDSSYLLGCIPLRKETRMIQLWHACGAFKRFGYSLTGKKFGSQKRDLDRYPMYRNFSYVTVSSPQVAWAYEEAFALPPERIVATGIARTDVFFDKTRRQMAADKLKGVFPRAFAKGADRRIVLYAPTFRGTVAAAASPDVLDYAKLREQLGEEWIFLIKHHPFVKHPPKVPEACKGFVRDVSGEMEIEELLMVSDVCISDYSSLIFEYALLERPMIFLAHDLKDYGDWRGFYYPFREMTPGPVVTDTQGVARELAKLKTGFDPARVRAFRERFMSACDGHATARILELMKQDGSRERNL